MHKPWLLLVLAASVSLIASAEPLSKSERDRAMSYLHATRKQYIDALAGVSPTQAKWKAAPDRWSVAEVAEHIAVSETFLLELVSEKFVKAPPATEAQKAATKGKDDLVQKAVPDRSQKFQAPEPLVPGGKFATLDATRAAFLAAREKTIRFVEKTDIPLRNFVVPHPAMKELDAYQWILLLAAHTERHLKQLQEVKDSPGYPAH